MRLTEPCLRPERLTFHQAIWHVNQQQPKETQNEAVIEKIGDSEGRLTTICSVGDLTYGVQARPKRASTCTKLREPQTVGELCEQRQHRLP